MRTSGQRADAQDNRRRLIEATGRLLARRGSLTLTELAAEAGVSRSTTYRNFPTPTTAIESFIDDFLNDFENAVAANATVDQSDRLGRLTDLCTAWGNLVEQRSHALVHVRSTEGFLARVRRGDPIIGRIHRIVRATIDDTISRGGLPAIDPDYAVFLWNLLLDPRELLDLAEHNNQNLRWATQQLTSDYLLVLQATATPQE
jgi:AcrR family transcriptional regulator